MQVGLNPNKSFRFIKAVTSVVAQAGQENVDRGKTQNIQQRNQQDLTPQQVQNKTRSSAIKTQARFSTQDRFIDIVI